jgi:hypothetical protein
VGCGRTTQSCHYHCPSGAIGGCADSLSRPILLQTSPASCITGTGSSAAPIQTLPNPCRCAHAPAAISTSNTSQYTCARPQLSRHQLLAKANTVTAGLGADRRPLQLARWMMADRRAGLQSDSHKRAPTTVATLKGNTLAYNNHVQPTYRCRGRCGLPGHGCVHSVTTTLSTSREPHSPR